MDNEVGRFPLTKALTGQRTPHKNPWQPAGCVVAQGVDN
jgi:hypothetical protein